MNKNLICLSFLLISFIFTENVLALNNECDTRDVPLTKINNLKQDVPDHGRTFQVPVIFHVLWNINAENIADANIQDMIISLNADFMSLNDDFALVPEVFRNAAGNPNISFVLASSLPDGNPTNGVIRKKTKYKIFSGKERHNMFKESKIIAPDRYLNVYIVDYKKGVNGGYPGSKNDGIIVDYKKANGVTRTITHETGHWLNLLHIWDYPNSVRGYKNCRNDGLRDTPITLIHSSGKSYTHPKYECGKKNAVMFMNFMDYGN